MRSGAWEPAPLWAVGGAVAAVGGWLIVLLLRILAALTAIRDGAARIEQRAARAEARDGRERRGPGDGREAVHVDGWLDPAARFPRPDHPEGPADGVLLRGRVANRTTTPVWDVLAEVVDPRSGHLLPLVPLARHVLPPGDEWPLEWIAGCTVTAPGTDVIELPPGPGDTFPAECPPAFPATVSEGVPGGSGAHRPLPVPDVLDEAGATRPQLRITFSDTRGRWARQGAWVTPVTRDRHLPPGSAALSRASDEFRDAASQERPIDTARIAIEVGLALHEVARHRLGRFSASPLDLSALPGLLTRHPLAARLRLGPGPAARRPGDAPDGVLADLAHAVRCLDERIGTASGRTPAAARLLLAHAGSVLTVLNALRIGPPGAAHPDGAHPDRAVSDRAVSERERATTLRG